MKYADTFKIRQIEAVKHVKAVKHKEAVNYMETLKHGETLNYMEALKHMEAVNYMETLKYKVIRSKEQYNEYCKALEGLLDKGSKDKSVVDEIDLLTLLIEKWDEAHSTLKEVDPIRLLHSFMEDHKMKAKDLVNLLGVSKGYVSDILHYKKGLSKEVIRKLAERFKVSQEAFNRPYKLRSSVNVPLHKGSAKKKTTKELVRS